MALTTTGDLIRLALRSTGVTGVGQSPAAEDTTDCLALLTMMVGQWQRKRWLVWDLVDTAVVSTGAATYTVGPTGTFPMARPDRIDSAFARLIPSGSISGTFLTGGTLPTSDVGLVAGAYWNNGGVVCVVTGGTLPTSDAGLAPGAYWNNGGVLCVVTGGTLPTSDAGLATGAYWDNGSVVCVVAGGTPSSGSSSLFLDYPLGIIESREDYNKIALKGLTTFPGAVFYESAWPTGVLHFWPIPAAAQFELHIATKAPLPVYTGLTDALNVPAEYVEALLYSLAVRIAMNYGQQPNPGHVAAMRAALNTVRMANVQVATLDMPAGISGRRGGSGMAASASPAFQSGLW